MYTWFIKLTIDTILYFYSAYWCYWNIYAYVAHGAAYSGHHHTIKRVTETYILVPGLFLVGRRKVLRAFIRTHDNHTTHDLLYILRLRYELRVRCAACMRFAGNRQVRKFINSPKYNDRIIITKIIISFHLDIGLKMYAKIWKKIMPRH